VAELPGGQHDPGEQDRTVDELPTGCAQRAPVHERSSWPLPAEVYNTSLQNMTGHPALSLPAGRLPNGLPFELQVTGPQFRDHLLLASLAPGRRLGPGPRWPTATNRSTPVSRNRCQATCLGLTLPLTCPGSSRAQLRVDRTGLSADRSRRTGRRGSLDRRH
jgi:hypothetical protein